MGQTVQIFWSVTAIGSLFSSSSSSLADDRNSLVRSALFGKQSHVGPAKTFGTGHHPAWLRFPLGGRNRVRLSSSRMASGKRGGAIQLRNRASAEPSGHSLDFRHVGSNCLANTVWPDQAEWGAVSRLSPDRCRSFPPTCLGRPRRLSALGSAHAYSRFCRTKGLAPGSAARPRPLTTVCFAFRLALRLLARIVVLNLAVFFIFRSDLNARTGLSAIPCLPFPSRGESANKTPLNLF
jgi:hypothetical protein